MTSCEAGGFASKNMRSGPHAADSDPVRTIWWKRQKPCGTFTLN